MNLILNKIKKKKKKKWASRGRTKYGVDKYEDTEQQGRRRGKAGHNILFFIFYFLILRNLAEA